MIPKRKYRRWDGKLKNLTSDCEGCGFYRKVTFPEYAQKLCGFGVEFKVLEKTEKLTRCRIRNRTPKKNSIDYLDKIIPIALEKTRKNMN
ncbi:hypothetical protein K9L16_03620 [Candidatus Pacearchaeota archaeon]|nr:hypothetical protein [Candidatus Pacearchaeota archaeon]